MSNEKSIKTVIQDMLSLYKLDKKFNESNIIDAWPEIVGKMIANNTKSLKIIDTKLVITVNSAALKQELFYHRTVLCEKVNNFANQKLITEVIIK